MVITCTSASGITTSLELGENSGPLMPILLNNFVGYDIFSQYLFKDFYVDQGTNLAYISLDIIEGKLKFVVHIANYKNGMIALEKHGEYDNLKDALGELNKLATDDPSFNAHDKNGRALTREYKPPTVEKLNH